LRDPDACRISGALFSFNVIPVQNQQVSRGIAHAQSTCGGSLMIHLKNVLVAVDFDDASTVALRYARSLAKTFGARLHLIHVMENLFLRPMANDPHAIEAGISKRLLDVLTDEDRTVLHAVPVIRKSDAPAEEIVKYAQAEHVDLIVMGTHGRPGVAHLLMGSVAEKVVRSAPCPVLTLRHPEREFVVADEPAAVPGT
jgi:nucleotide-binding universal stress UspA family protein